MTTNEIVEYLRGLAKATMQVAMRDDTGARTSTGLLMQSSVLLEACEKLAWQSSEIKNLHVRLVRQSHALEIAEAMGQQKTWPLLEDDTGESL